MPGIKPEAISAAVRSGGEEGSPGIPWDQWLQCLESVGAEGAEWTRAEEFAAYVLELAEHKRRAATGEMALRAALAAFGPYSDLVCYFEMEELVDWEFADFLPEDVPETIRDLEKIRMEFEHWRKRVYAGSNTARADIDAATRIGDGFERARARREPSSAYEAAELDAVNTGRKKPVRCPRCASANIRYSNAQTVWDRALNLVLALDAIRCRSCRHRFHRYLGAA
jgi:hypothetical protein